MEVESVKEIFLRSKKVYSIKYVNNIGNGDSKTFTTPLKVNPYGDEHDVLKS